METGLSALWVALGITMILLPFVVIYLLIRAALAYFRGKHKHKSAKSWHEKISDRSIVLWSLGINSLYAALVGTNVITPVVFGSSYAHGEEAAIRILTAILFIVAGYLIGNTVGKMLMVFGVFLVVFALPYVFTGFSSLAIFLMVLTGFIAIIYLAVRYNRESNNA